MMIHKTCLTLALAASLLATGCGGGGSGGSSGSGPGPAVESRNQVSGPLDVLQAPLSSQVLAPLTTAVAGTPLAGVVNCLDQSVIGDVLDIADALAIGLQPGAANPAAALNATAANVQAELGDLVADLQGLVASLAGGVGCSGNAVALPGLGNPLAGTPLAALGTQLLPVLNSVQSLLAGAPAGSLSLGQLSGLLGQVTQAFNGAIGLVPPQAANAPIVGPLLDVISQTLADVQLTVAAAATGNPATVTARVTTTVQNLLDGLLTQVIPIAAIEGTSGQGALVSGPIQDVIDQLTAVLGGGLGSLPGADLAEALADPIALLLNPLESDVLSLILAPIQSAIAGGLGSGAGGPTGTPLDAVLATITGVLSGGAGGDPLTSLLGSLLGSLGGACPLAGTPLAGLCGLLGR